MKKPEGLVIFGFGGHARSVGDVAIRCGIENLLFIDAHATNDEDFFGHPVQSALPDSLPAGWMCISASGDAAQRREHMRTATSLGWPIATLIAPSATIGLGAAIGAGTFVAQQAHVGPLAAIAEGCIINSGAVVDHECVVEAFTHISINTTIAGRCRIGQDCFIGAGATVIDKVSICAGVTIGAGAVVLGAINAAGTYVGIPATRTSV